ncbi:MAG: hypothetical protein PUB18_00825 [bacterium]|nr:hypothetical protein [bacterium]
MLKMINMLLCFLKIIILFTCFVFTFYIFLNMHDRLGKNIVDSIFSMFPFGLLLFLFFINVFLKQRAVNDCFFYNVVCCFLFCVILFVIYRTFFDRNMVLIIELGYDINFYYFADFIAPMKIMLYLLSLSNIGLMFSRANKLC